MNNAHISNTNADVYGAVIMGTFIITARLVLPGYINSNRVNVEKERLYPVKSWTHLPSNPSTRNLPAKSGRAEPVIRLCWPGFTGPGRVLGQTGRRDDRLLTSKVN